MNLNDFKADYTNGARAITDKDTIRNVVNLMARLPTEEMYSPYISVTPHGSDQKIPLRERALGYYRDFLGEEHLPETFSELLFRFSNYYANYDYCNKPIFYYDYLSRLSLGFLVTPDNKKNN